jgi:hypothetical protein
MCKSECNAVQLQFCSRVAMHSSQHEGVLLLLLMLLNMQYWHASTVAAAVHIMQPHFATLSSPMFLSYNCRCNETYTPNFC